MMHQKQRLSVFENGMRYETMFGTKTLLWRNITKIHVTYSYVYDPNSVLKVSLKQKDGPKVAFDMNWKNRRELVKLLLPILSPNK